MRKKENIESLLGSMGMRAVQAGLVEDYFPQKRIPIYLSPALAKSIIARIDSGLEPDIANPNSCKDMLKPIIVSDDDQILYITDIE